MIEPNEEPRDYVLMVRFAGKEGDRVVDEYGQKIHDEYMERWGGDEEDGRVFTTFLAKLRGKFSYMIRYSGPEKSAEWLEDRIREAAREMDQKVELATSEVVNDMTQRF